VYNEVKEQVQEAVESQKDQLYDLAKREADTIRYNVDKFLSGLH